MPSLFFLVQRDYFTDGWARSGISGYFHTLFRVQLSAEAPTYPTSNIPHDKALYSSSQQARRTHTRPPNHDGQRRLRQGAPHSRGAPQGTVLLRATRIRPLSPRARPASSHPIHPRHGATRRDVTWMDGMGRGEPLFSF